MPWCQAECLGQCLGQAYSPCECACVRADAVNAGGRANNAVGARPITSLCVSGEYGV